MFLVIAIFEINYNFENGYLYSSKNIYIFYFILVLASHLKNQIFRTLNLLSSIPLLKLR